MQWMRRAWRGEEKLWKAFFYSGGLLILFSLIPLATAFLAYKFGWHFSSNATTSTSDDIRLTSGFVIGTAIIFDVPFMIWQTVIVWRCSPNVRLRMWGIIARGIIVVNCVWVVIGFFSTIVFGLPALLGDKAALYKLTCQYNIAGYARQKGFAVNTLEEKKYIEEHLDDFTAVQ